MGGAIEKHAYVTFLRLWLEKLCSFDSYKVGPVVQIASHL